MQADAYRGRFAPSPTGPLHLGSLVAALASWLFARRAGGAWLVRIEDIDPPREVPGAAAAQLATLHAMGLVPDQPPWFQSERGEAYEAALRHLDAAGLLYACRCSRNDLAPFGGVHPPRCVASDASRPAALRVRVGEAEVAFRDAIQGEHRERLGETSGDFVVRRSDGFAAYQLAVVVDDAAQGITEVVRGADLLDSTPRQIWLQRQLGVPVPRHAHVPVLLGPDGHKLGKSLRSAPLDPANPIPALATAFTLLGQPAGALPRRGTPQHWLQQALALFDPGCIPRRPQMALPEGLHGAGDADARDADASRAARGM